MTTVLLAIVIFLILIAGMAIGVIMGGKPIAGSCGGMSAIGMEKACDVCNGDPEVCETEQQKAMKSATNKAHDTDELAVDATRN